jgi:hypothetical protein
MEAVPRLPMISFDLKVSPESTSFGPQLKQVLKTVFVFLLHKWYVLFPDGGVGLVPKRGCQMVC